MSRRIQTGPAPPQRTPAASYRSTTIKEDDLGVSFTDIDEELRLGPAPVPPAFNSASQASPDGYIDRLVKYIPSEIIALYLGAANVVPAKDSGHWISLWVIASLSAICTPVYMYAVTKQSGKPTLWSQIAISSAAFPIWVFAIGGPFRSFSWYDEKQWIAAIVITFATFFAGLYKPQPA